MTEDERRHHRHEDGQRQDGRGVDTGEAINEALSRRTAGLRLLDGVDDVGQGGVTRHLGHPELERPGGVDGAREHLGTRPLLHRYAFSGDGRLINRRVAFDDFSIERHSLSRTHPHYGAHGDSLGLHLGPSPVSLLNSGRLGRHPYEIPDGVPSPIDREFLHEFRQRK